MSEVSAFIKKEK